MSEQKRSTPQRSDAPTQRRRSNASPRRRSSRRGGMPQWLSGWIEHMALFFSTLGARIRRIGPRARTVMRESRARNFPESNRFLVQVFLVIGGMFPMWRSLLHERVMGTPPPAQPRCQRARGPLAQARAARESVLLYRRRSCCGRDRAVFLVLHAGNDRRV